jgi:hypothetical protein
MQRFRPVLVCCDPNPTNPEELLRDKQGKYVLYEDAITLIKEALEWNWHEPDSIPENIKSKFKEFI